MDAKRLRQIRHDLDLVLPKGGYTLTRRRGKPLHLSWDKSVHADVRRFAAEILRQHGVEFECDHEPARPRRAARRTKKRKSKEAD